MCLSYYEFYENNSVLTMIKSGCSHTESLCPAVSSQDIRVDSRENKGLSWAEQDLASEPLIQLNSILNLQTVPLKKQNKTNYNLKNKIQFGIVFGPLISLSDSQDPFVWNQIGWQTNINRHSSCFF